MKFEKALQIILSEEELKRVNMSNIRDHFVQKIGDIEKGMKITENEKFTEMLKKELKEWDDAIQKGREQGNTSRDFKFLEDEWIKLLNVLRDYDIATRIHNRNYPKNKIRTIKERVGFVLTPSVSTEE